MQNVIFKGYFLMLSHMEGEAFIRPLPLDKQR